MPGPSLMKEPAVWRTGPATVSVASGSTTRTVAGRPSGTVKVSPFSSVAVGPV